MYNFVKNEVHGIKIYEMTFLLITTLTAVSTSTALHFDFDVCVHLHINKKSSVVYVGVLLDISVSRVVLKFCLKNISMFKCTNLKFSSKEIIESFGISGIQTKCLFIHCIIDG